MSPSLKPLPVPRRQPIVPILSAVERKAYQAAWRIVNDPQPQNLNGLAGAGARRSRHVDWLASIIKEEMARWCVDGCQCENCLVRGSGILLEQL